MNAPCPGHFECARCHRTFTKIAPWRDPMTEAKNRFGDAVEREEVVSVCTDCDRAMQAWLATPLGQQALAQWKAEQR